MHAAPPICLLLAIRPDLPVRQPWSLLQEETDSGREQPRPILQRGDFLHCLIQVTQANLVSAVEPQRDGPQGDLEVGSDRDHPVGALEIVLTVGSDRTVSLSSSP